MLIMYNSDSYYRVAINIPKIPGIPHGVDWVF